VVLAELCMMNFTAILPHILTHLFIVVETLLAAQTAVFRVHPTALVPWTRRAAWIVALSPSRVIPLSSSSPRIDACSLALADV